MKIGCHVSGLQARRAAPYNDGVDNAIALGFDALELIAMTAAELADYYTPAKCAELREKVSNAGLLVSQFALYSPACQDLLSEDATRSDAALAVVDQAIAVCAALGCPIFNLVSHWADGLVCPHGYPPSYIHPASKGLASYGATKVTISLPQGWNYSLVWERYLGVLAEIAARAGKHGVTLAVEGHANVIVSGTDAMLRMFDRLDDANIVINFDTAWHLIQRELLPMSIYKLGRRIGHVHLRDADGLLNYGVPVGEGVIAWDEVFVALRSIGYEGVVSFEYAGFDQFTKIAAASLDHVRRLMREA